MAKGKVKVIIMVTIIAVVAIFGFLIIGNLNSLGSPEIQVTPSNYDFGDVPKELLNKNFIVKNTGNSTLEIKNIITSCGCTTAEIDLEIIEPGQSANLLVTIDPYAMSDIDGDILRIVYIASNDPENPEVEVQMRANFIGG